MIANEQTFTINTSIDKVWNYVEDIPRWAAIFPGHQNCELLSEHDSTWTIKVSAAGVTRTDKVQVHVEEWAGPERVDFVFSVDDLPVEGNGSYLASSRSPLETDVTLKVCIIGSGPMAPMWEAVGTPMLPELVKTFAAKLTAEIEQAAGVENARTADNSFALSMFKGMVKSGFATLAFWLKRLFGLGNKNSSKDKISNKEKESSS
ncbi:MAG: SRPBCC family protein [Pseudomonadota bacterium]|nr:SRPBCC family protein [Pseudomonadota bacterium]